MDDILPGGEGWSDGPDTGISLLSSYPIFAGQGMDPGKVNTDANEEGETSDPMILDTMDVYMHFSEIDPPLFPGGLPMDDASTTSTTPVPHGLLTPPLTSQSHEPLRDSENDDLYWKRFDILPSTPTDHAFYDRPVAQPSRTFMARLHKEYRALSTGLPGTFVLVCLTGSNVYFIASIDSRTGL